MIVNEAQLDSIEGVLNHGARGLTAKDAEDLIETVRALRELVKLFHIYCEWPDCSECKRAVELLARTG